ncbi:hypothetical protein H0H92_007731 [Tricholoma furcatifolium]|nr:hypothetical protein H0H92_007731 [Tricholoma furcatifolium]
MLTSTQWGLVVPLGLALVALTAGLESGEPGSMVPDQTTVDATSATPIPVANDTLRAPTNGTGAGNVSTSKSGSHDSVSHGCKKDLRQEWRNISAETRFHYLDAVLCLQRLNSTSAITGARTRFDDFQGHHINVTPYVHEVGQFLPWHRWFMHAYEVALRKECNYRGPIPYWDWTQDVDPEDPNRFRFSPVFDALGGFGNLAEHGPLSSGVFATQHVAFGTGPPPNITYHLLEREFDHTLLRYLTKSAVHATLRKETFETFRIELEGRPITHKPKIHDSGHRAVGGDLGNTWSSPGDPLFYLHHANLDRLWWKWQSVNPKERLYQISGRSTQTPPYVDVTLNYTLLTGPLSEPLQIHQVMDIGNNLLCYSYV